jgi:AsmA protein
MKKILIAITSIIFVLVVLLLSVPYWFDVNDYKQEIVSAIKEKAGFDIAIGGKITARVVPDISLVVEDVSVASSQKTAGNLFASKQLVINVKLAPIFNKKIEIESLKVIEPIINLHVSKLGESNWELKKTGKLPEDSDEVTEVSYGEAANSSELGGHFALNELEIKDGLFKFFDEKSGKKIDVSGLNIHTSIKQGDNNIAVSGKLNIFKKKEKGAFSLKGLYSLSVGVYKLQNLDITLDEIKANGDIESDFSNIKPAFKVSLYTNEINLDDYKMAGDVGTENSKTAIPAVNDSSTKHWSSEKFDVSSLNKADVNLNFKASAIKSGGLNIGETAVNAYLKNGRLTSNFKDISLYGGIVNGEAVIDAASGLPAVKAIFDVVNIDIAQLLEGTSKKDSVAGKANIKGGLYSAGYSQKEIIEKLSGKASLNIVDGTVKGVDLVSMGKNLPAAFDKEGAEHKTKFQEISGDFDIKTGIVTNENFILKSDVINFEGRGQIDLPLQKIDYKLTPKYSQDFQKADEVVKPVIPILITGNMYKPVFRLELKTIVQDLINNPEAAKNLVDQLKRDLKDAKKDITGEDAGKALKNLFQ